MGYTTDFSGAFTLTPALTKEQADYLTAFSGSRRMNRDPKKFKDKPEYRHNKLGLGLGKGCGYFVDADGYAGQDRDDPSITDYNGPPPGQPGLWCQWIPTNDGETLEWDLGEKFYNYEEWLEYLIEHFLTPWGIKVNGTVQWYGEEPDDRGLLIVEDSVIDTKYAKVTFE